MRAGGELRTPIGVLAIREITVVRERDITEADARRAGFESREELVRELGRRRTGDLYRIVFRRAGPDPQVKLRQKTTLTSKGAARSFLDICAIAVDSEPINTNDKTNVPAAILKRI
ncbi:MAG: hypothetical protein OEN01_08380 [Candidatus Krumholzibacteria bacterium]|nr:hypothetical protein [Candidatus Krumholzibacteria bacterium]